MARLSDEQLIDLWSETRSPSEISRRCGITVRAVTSRLRKLGVPPLASRSEANKPPPAKIAEGRISIQIENGTAIIFSDAHYIPGVASTAHRALLKLCRELRPVLVVANGDLFDGGTISRYPRIGWDKKPTVMEELRAVEERLTEVENVTKGAQRVWTLGNHDARFETFLAANAPQFEGVRGFHLKDHFPLWRPAWSVWINDDVVVKHRYRGGIHATRTNTLNSGKTIVTGHLHSLKVTPFSDYNGTRFGVDTGTLADPYGPQFSDYTELNPVDWRSGFAVLTFWRGRLLWPDLVHVIEEGLVEFRASVLEV